MTYEDFEIVIDRTANIETYSVSVVRPCGGRFGDANIFFQLSDVSDETPGGDFDDTKPLRDIEVIGAEDEPDRYQLRRPEALSDGDAKLVGMRLSRAVLKEDVRDRLRSCRDFVAGTSGLRMRLNLSRAPELGALPWEYLRLPGTSGEAVALDASTALVRYLETASAIPPLKVRPPLRTLIATSMPDKLPLLNLDEEVQKILEALKPLERFVEVIHLKNAGLSDVEDALKDASDNKCPFHIFHFSGHGAFDMNTQSGVLLFEDDGVAVPVTGETLGLSLQGYTSDLRLIFLNACEGAVHTISNVYASVAAKVMQTAGVPAAIAMQYKISDKAAIKFASSLYAELAQGGNLEPAIRSARMDVKSLPSNEWATPVFYLRAENGNLLDIRVPKPPPGLDAHYQAVRAALPSCQLVFFLGLNVNSIDRPAYDLWEPKLGLPTTQEICSYLERKFQGLPPGASLASMAQWLALQGKNLNDEFITLFRGRDQTATPRLYNVLSDLARILTDRLRAADAAALDDEVQTRFPSRPHRSLLFVTTTYDQTLEHAFRAKDIKSYHVLTYGRNDSGSFFTHSRYMAGGLEEEFVTKLGPFAEKANEYRNWREDAGPVILKLPGEIRPELQPIINSATFAVAEDDFFSFAATDIGFLLPSDIISQIKESRHVYLGYDVQNWSLRLLWDLLCGGQVPRGVGSYAVVKHPKEDPDAPFWEKFKVQLAAAELDDYVAGLEINVLQVLLNNVKQK